MAVDEPVPESARQNRDRTKDGLTVRERVHRNFRWSVATIHAQPVADGPVVRTRVLMFGNQDETDLETFPFADAEAKKLAMALLREPEDGSPAN